VSSPPWVVVVLDGWLVVELVLEPPSCVVFAEPPPASCVVVAEPPPAS
jgi:hypothetical protein